MKENQRVAITKRMLQEGLLGLLQTKHIDSIRVTELCAVSGINRATFYRHYQSPRDVLDQMRRDILQEVYSLSLPLSSAQDPIRGLSNLCRYFQAHKAQLLILFQYHSDEGFQELLNGFAQAQPRQGIDPVELKLASCYYAGGIFSLIRQWLTDGLDKTPEQIGSLIHCLVTAQSRQGEAVTDFVNPL